MTRRAFVDESAAARTRHYPLAAVPENSDTATPHAQGRTPTEIARLMRVARATVYRRIAGGLLLPPELR